MARKDRTLKEKARREKICELLQMANIGSMDDIQSLFKEAISEFMENGLEAELDDGRTCRIPVRKGDGEWEWKINGVSEYDCFEQIPYAG